MVSKLSAQASSYSLFQNISSYISVLTCCTFITVKTKQIKEQMWKRLTCYLGSVGEAIFTHCLFWEEEPQAAVPAWIHPWVRERLGDFICRGISILLSYLTQMFSRLASSRFSHFCHCSQFVTKDYPTWHHLSISSKTKSATLMRPMATFTWSPL